MQEVENQKQKPDQKEKQEPKKSRNNTVIQGFNIVKEKEGWRVVKIVAQSNGRCKFVYLSLPDLRVYTIERLRRILEIEMWRDN